MSRYLTFCEFINVVSMKHYCIDETMPIRIAQVGALGYDPLKIAARAIVSDYSDLYDGTQILRISRNQMNLC
jgi:hypothetical protein